MAHLTSLKRTEADQKAERDDGSVAPSAGKGEPELHLDQHHMRKLGLDGPLAQGQEIHLRARGVVSGSHSSETEHGAHHSMRVKLTHATLKHDRDEERADRRGDIEASYAKSEAKKK